MDVDGDGDPATVTDCTKAPDAGECVAALTDDHIATCGGPMGDDMKAIRKACEPASDSSVTAIALLAITLTLN
jgi:hypothetical protein